MDGHVKVVLLAVYDTAAIKITKGLAATVVPLMYQP